MAKKIRISAVHAIEFNQRARGEETPYWVGTVWDVSGAAATRAGDFENGGRGGPTCVRLRPPGRRDALLKLGEAAFSDLGVEALEADGHVVAYAEFIGYALRCGCGEFTLQDYTDMVWGGGSLGTDGDSLLARTAGQKARAARACDKAEGIMARRRCLPQAESARSGQFQHGETAS